MILSSRTPSCNRPQRPRPGNMLLTAADMQKLATNARSERCKANGRSSKQRQLKSSHDKTNYAGFETFFTRLLQAKCGKVALSASCLRAPCVTKAPVMRKSIKCLLLHQEPARYLSKEKTENFVTNFAALLYTCQVYCMARSSSKTIFRTMPKSKT